MPRISQLTSGSDHLLGSNGRRPPLGWAAAPSARLLAVAVFVGAVALSSAFPASAQAVQPCGGGNEQQVGQTTSGGVVVPLCVALPPPPPVAGSAGRPVGWRADYQTGDGTVTLPPGWRPAYGLFRNVAIGTDPATGRTIHDYILSVGHETPDQARQGLQQECLARDDVLWPETDCTGDGTFIQMPFVTVVHYPDDPYWGSQRAQYEVYSGSRPWPGSSPAPAGGRDYCFGSGLAPDRCGQPVRHVVNGEIPAEGRGSRR